MANDLFKWRHYEPEIILLHVRWYFNYPISYRDVAEMMSERGLAVNESTIQRWVICYAPELGKRVRRHLRPTNNSWHLDETYLKVHGEQIYLYRIVDSIGETVDFLLCRTLDKDAAKRLLRKTRSRRNSMPVRSMSLSSTG